MRSNHHPAVSASSSVPLSHERAWSFLVALAGRCQQGPGCLPGDGAFGMDEAGEPRLLAYNDPAAVAAWREGRGWCAAAAAPAAVRDLLDLYLPVCCGKTSKPLVVGHLGQSVDGHIATESGDSCFVTGHENIVHLHRMRALCDAIIVGAGTVAADNPRLTTRLVPGENPVRVILDPRARLKQGYGVFADGEAPTVVICDQARSAGARGSRGLADVIGVPARDGRLDLVAVLDVLQERGLGTVFIEGGGLTVSCFLEAGLLDRLQLAVAPVLMGAGRPGLQLPPAPAMHHCRRPPHRIFRMGEDILWDFDLQGGDSSGVLPAPPLPDLQRVS